jgi:hypothetical protein
MWADRSEKMLLNLPQEIKHYFIKPALKDEFFRFCKEGERDENGNYVHDPETNKPIKGVLEWLREKGVMRADFWTAEDRSLGTLLLIVAVSTGDSDWWGIPGLRKYLLGDYAPVIKPRPDLNIGE